MQSFRHGMKTLAKQYATISSGKDVKGKSFLTLEHRARALALWRDIIRNIRKIPPSETREEMRTFARGEFERHKYVHDLGHIRYLISSGKTQFDTMRRYIEQNIL
ncbi:hypothetical protein M433DRAFT_318954 [Acidomyces richmondensis BFW]|nr:MAG: hypothetical protein FE78DRAFT_461084 [Acidomyces sp. 'richmondensis']KYG44153.1 hypothetical protein M433DRAFT_318954 [Acidomyces richmondensis BFW]